MAQSTFVGQEKSSVKPSGTESEPPTSRGDKGKKKKGR